VKQEKLYLSHSNLKSKHKLIMLPRLQLLTYGTYEPFLNPLMAHTSEFVVYVKKEELYLTHSNLMSKYKLVKLPRLQLLTVSIAICYPRCVIKAMPHDKIYTMKWEPCGVHGIQCTIAWRKLNEVCQTRTLVSGFWRYPDVLVRIGNTSLKNKDALL